MSTASDLPTARSRAQGVSVAQLSCLPRHHQFSMPVKLAPKTSSEHVKVMEAAPLVAFGAAEDDRLDPTRLADRAVATAPRGSLENLAVLAGPVTCRVVDEFVV